MALSAGAPRSPQLLMLSGVGPAARLHAHGIDVVADLPGVGHRLHDHPCYPRYLSDPADRLRPRTALKRVGRLFEAPAPTAVTGPPLHPAAGSSDAELDRWIQDRVVTQWHPAEPTAWAPTRCQWSTRRRCRCTVFRTFMS